MKTSKIKLMVAALAVAVAGAVAVVPSEPASAATKYTWNATTKKCEKNDAGSFASLKACKDAHKADLAGSDDCAGLTGMELSECLVSGAAEGSGQEDGLFTILQGILNAIFGVVGFIAVIMLVYGGIQYTISSGDAGKVKKAKDTILYGIVGLIISLLAAAIVNFVLANMLS